MNHKRRLNGIRDTDPEKLFIPVLMVGLWFQVCNVAPIAGETKVWQYVTLMRKIYLIDCPGIVPPAIESLDNMVLKGTIRTEYLSTPSDFIPEIMRRVKHDYLRRTYKVRTSKLFGKTCSWKLLRTLSIAQIGKTS